MADGWAKDGRACLASGERDMVMGEKGWGPGLPGALAAPRPMPAPWWASQRTRIGPLVQRLVGRAQGLVRAPGDGPGLGVGWGSSPGICQDQRRALNRSGVVVVVVVV